MNGRKLFNRLYTQDNITNDAVRMFQKYKSLMKYEPQRPDEKYFLEDNEGYISDGEEEGQDPDDKEEFEEEDDEKDEL